MHLILGYGVSGKACEALLRRLNLPSIAVDSNPQSGVAQDAPDFPLENISQVILSPGIAPSHPIVQRAIACGIEVIGEAEFAMRHVENRCVGITGSNGKTTTALLATHALRFAGLKARAVGNVGFALSQYLLAPDPAEILIVELSSFQLETLRTKKLEFAVFLNLTPNHLDRYSSMEEYMAAKANIQRCLSDEGKLWVSSQVWNTCRAMLSAKNVEICDHAIQMMLPNGLPQQNARAAEKIAVHFGVSRGAFMESLKSFERPPHRLEWVADVGGVSYYNDSKATSVEAVLHAVSLFEGPLLLIVGGVHKGAPYEPWIQAFRGKVRRLIAYGEAASKIEAALGSVYPLVKVSLFAEAVAQARAAATPGDVVILSPGCSSYDQFANYECRGDVFKQIVRGFS